MKPKYKTVRKMRIFISRLFVAVLSLFIIFSDSRWEDIGMWSTVFFLAGAFMAGLATVGRLWCSLYISGYKSNTLITIGPYSICRHPLYFFSLIGAVGVGLATETLTIPLIIIVAFAGYYPMVIRREQQQLHKLHEGTYEDYCRRTPIFIPSLKLLNEPEEYVVKPRVFSKRLLDTTCFVWLIGILELIEAFHEAGVIPVIFKIY